MGRSMLYLVLDLNVFEFVLVARNARSLRYRHHTPLTSVNKMLFVACNWKRFSSQRANAMTTFYEAIQCVFFDLFFSPLTIRVNIARRLQKITIYSHFFGKYSAYITVIAEFSVFSHFIGKFTVPFLTLFANFSSFYHFSRNFSTCYHFSRKFQFFFSISSGNFQSFFSLWKQISVFISL